MTLSVDPKYHPNIIGRKGATINKIRDDHEVRIQLPDKDGPNAADIMIMGYEHQVKAAQEDILKIVHDLVSNCLIPSPHPHREEKGSGYNTTSRPTLEGVTKYHSNFNATWTILRSLLL